MLAAVREHWHELRSPTRTREWSFYMLSQANCPSKAIKKPLIKTQPLRQNPWEVMWCFHHSITKLNRWDSVGYLETAEMYISGERKALDTLTLGLVTSKRWRNGDVNCASILVSVVRVDVNRIIVYCGVRCFGRWLHPKLFQEMYSMLEHNT